MNKPSFLSNLSIMLVDDDPSSLQLMERFLKRKVGKIYTAVNGQLGLMTYNQVHPDIIVTDLKMPLMGGIAMSQEIRKENADVPIIITTALADKDIIISAVDVGIDKYLVKPFDTEELMNALEEISNKVLRLQQGLATSEGLILDKVLKQQREEQMKGVFATMLKQDTGKGPLSIKTNVKGVSIQVIMEGVLTKYEHALCKNSKNNRVVNYNRELYYLDRKMLMEDSMSETLGIICRLDSVKVDSAKDSDTLRFVLKIR